MSDEVRSQQRDQAEPDDDGSDGHDANYASGGEFRRWLLGTFRVLESSITGRCCKLVGGMTYLRSAC
jgi:hypothetical protein